MVTDAEKECSVVLFTFYNYANYNQCSTYINVYACRYFYIQASSFWYFEAHISCPPPLITLKGMLTV